MPSLRISIIGTSCSGKTTIAKLISEKLHIPHIELDALHWLPNWQESDNDEFLSLVSHATSADNWIVDGNYSMTRPIVWNRVTHILWLNYPFIVVFWRALRRTISRAWSKEVLFSGNTESWKQSFFSKDSILLWVIQTYAKRQRQYSKLLADLPNPDIKVYVIRNNQEIAKCLTELGISS
jgi:adenylate kinase family enzyme